MSIYKNGKRSAFMDDNAHTLSNEQISALVQSLSYAGLVCAAGMALVFSRANAMPATEIESVLSDAESQIKEIKR